MGLSDLVEVEGFADLDAQCARSDLRDQILERRRMKSSDSPA